jgi:hypothetical protein
MRTMSVLGDLLPRGRTRSWLLRQLRRMQSVLAVLRRPPWVPPGHFYSPVSTRTDVDRQLSWSGAPAGVDMREDEQVALLRALAPLLTDFSTSRYRAPNEQYDVVDATFLQAMLRHHRPRRIIEVGSGHSTMAILDTADRHLPDLEITCIEPYPDRLLGLLRPQDATRVIRLMTSWASTTHPDLLPPALRGLPTGALWVQRAEP